MDMIVLNTDSYLVIISFFSNKKITTERTKLRKAPIIKIKEVQIKSNASLFFATEEGTVDKAHVRGTALVYSMSSEFSHRLA